MKKSILCLLALIITTNVSLAQRGTITLTFNGQDAATLETLTLDRVKIHNLTKECDTTIYSPDNQITIDFLDDINEIQNMDFIIGNNYPNPFSGTTYFNIQLNEPEQINIRLIDNRGVVVKETTDMLQHGLYTFKIDVVKPGAYYIEVRSEKTTRTINLINNGQASITNYDISHSHTSNSKTILKTEYQYSGFLFDPGDELQITASAETYPDESINETPSADMLITFDMKPVPIAAFIIEDTIGAFPFTTSFTDLSLRNPETWQWNFGDGWSSSLQNNIHSFENSGYYSVSLIVGNEYGFDTLTIENVIHVKDIEIICDSTIGYAPLIVNFYGNCNIPDITSWTWDFDDGNTSNIQDPTHTFTEEGTYNHVKVTVTSGGNTYSDSLLIRVYTDAADVNFTADITHGWVPETISFTSSTNINNPIYYQWSFGDGGVSTDVNPVHTYDYPGVYTVMLQVFDNSGTVSSTKEDYITVRYCPGAVADADGNVYGTTGIGDYCWMSENLNVGVRIEGGLNSQTDNGITEKFCYGDLDSNCDEYGGLYQWDELMLYTTGNLQGLCPDDWHVATKDEWHSMLSTLGELAGLKLKSTYGWEQSGNGNNSSGFNAKPGGKFGGDGDYLDKGAVAYFWTPNNGDEHAQVITHFNYLGDVNVEEASGFSVRCVKDNTLNK